MAGGGDERGGGRVKYKDEMEKKTLEAFMCFYSERKKKSKVQIRPHSIKCVCERE